MRLSERERAAATAAHAAYLRFFDGGLVLDGPEHAEYRRRIVEWARISEEERPGE